MQILERLPRETGRDYALRTIRDNIITLKLEPGSQISENELAAEMDLSRTPVREALIELSKVKIIEIYPQRKSMVSLIDYELVEESRFMRNLLECAVAELDCEMATPQDIRRLEDNLQLLGQNNVPEEWTDAVGTDGNLVNNTLSYIKSGNGIDSVDEIVKTESVKQKLVYATVTYTNKSDEEINHMLYIGTLLLMDHEDGSYQIYDPTEQSGDDYDRVIWDGVARTAEMTYNSISEDYGNGGNYISSLKPGESIQVNMAWIVNENDLNNMYLNLNGDGAAYEFSDSMLKTGLVDIYQ